MSIVLSNDVECSSSSSWISFVSSDGRREEGENESERKLDNRGKGIHILPRAHYTNFLLSSLSLRLFSLCFRLPLPPPPPLSLLLAQGIIVKVLHEKLGDRFYRKKGVVEEVRDSFTGVVKMIETGDKIKIDQAHLETVIPAIGMAAMRIAVLFPVYGICTCKAYLAQ